MAEVSAVYATIAQVRAFGITTSQASDTEVGDGHVSITDALAVASRMVDDYCGWTTYGFAQSAPGVTETIDDVRGPLVFLPTYANAITAVTVSGRVIDSAAYIANMANRYGVRLLRLYIPGYLDVDGFPSATSVGIAGGGWRGFANPYGSQVAVTATWGFATVPTVVRRATTLLAASEIERSSDAEGLVMRSIQGTPDRHDSAYKASSDHWESQAYALLNPYRNVAGMVA